MALLLNTCSVKLSADVSHLPKALETAKKLFKEERSPWGNFFVYRRKFTHVIFLSGHVNVTGIRSILRLKEVRRELCEILRIPKNSELHLKIDNICSRGRSPFSFILLRELFDAIQAHLSDGTRICHLSEFVSQVSYKPDKFPSLHIKTKIGSILLFGTGKFLFVGYRKFMDGHYLLLVLEHLLSVGHVQHCLPLVFSRVLHAQSDRQN